MRYTQHWGRKEATAPFKLVHQSWKNVPKKLKRSFLLFESRKTKEDEKVKGVVPFPSHEVIEGLGSRLASEITHTGKKFTLTTKEINSLPAIQARFRDESEK